MGKQKINYKQIRKSILENVGGEISSPTGNCQLEAAFVKKEDAKILLNRYKNLRLIFFNTQKQKKEVLKLFSPQELKKIHISNNYFILLKK